MHSVDSPWTSKGKSVSLVPLHQHSTPNWTPKWADPVQCSSQTYGRGGGQHRHSCVTTGEGFNGWQVYKTGGKAWDKLARNFRPLLQSPLPRQSWSCRWWHRSWSCRPACRWSTRSPGSLPHDRRPGRCCSGEGGRFRVEIRVANRSERSTITLTLSN